ncbi:Siderochrome-iron transporter [Pleurostoma richardsiae]|uniref:Siderochrome-iron transporter n=1 Tax=Pleurostoma richardsiae TaxID=41990 RepID=A0AA38RD59_9PEZI|nr:Siderochrome-iron transporter [Pleurostoma richardsiae]
METNTTAHAVGFSSNDIDEVRPVDDATLDVELQKPDLVVEGEASGTRKMEAITAVWGKNGKMVLLTAEFDNTTVYRYYVFALSSFQRISASQSLTTAGGLCFATLKPLVAKLSDVFGRGELYPVWVLFFIIAHVLCAASPNYNAWAAGYMLHVLGQTGVNTINDILVADFSSARQRGFAVQIQFLPFMFMPFISAFVTDSVIGGIGWRWGIGMLAIVMPVGLAPLIGTVLGFQYKAKKLGFPTKLRISFYDFCSQIDLGGIALFCGGLALILLPASLAGTLPKGWRTGWLIACLVVGAVFLLLLPFYERFVAKHPILPSRYFKDLTITIALLVYSFDGTAAAVTHSYFYEWLIVARGLSVRDANLITAGTNVMRYKWIIAAGAVVRVIGYGVMFRIRTGQSSIAEVVVVQLIQGIGTGIVSTGCFVALTVAVPHTELAQMTSLAVCMNTLGSTIGAAIGGGIYTSHLRAELVRELGSMGTPKLIDAAYNSITVGLPAIGTPQRAAIARALQYNTIMAYFTYVGFATTIPVLPAVWFLPDRLLTDAQNLVEGQDPVEGRDP